jgi:hypothetical protein
MNRNIKIANYLLEENFGAAIEHSTNTINEIVAPVKPAHVKTKLKMKDSGTVWANKLRYKEFLTKKGTKVFVAFKDFGGNEECKISFETEGSFAHKDLNDIDVLKNVLYIVRREVDRKKYKSIVIEPKVEKDKANAHARFKIFKRLIQEYFKDYEIIAEYSSDFFAFDSIRLAKI